MLLSADELGEIYNQLSVLNPQGLEGAISDAIKNQGKGYYPGEYLTEGHIILGLEKKDKDLIVYTIASTGWFGFENAIFTKTSGTGAIPTVMTFTYNELGEYELLDYQEPRDGSEYAPSLKKLFPESLQKPLLSGNIDTTDLDRQQEAQAEVYLQNIGRSAQVQIDYVEKQLPEIDVTASNKLFSELSKHDSFLNNCPYWLGTREEIEEGIRYIYETAQSKADDGTDLITFSKTKEDGAMVEKRVYMIVGQEPMPIYP
ncbi:Peptidase M56 BlaR1 [Heliorestis convoluta]|uniref:Peptidase M56 BlaR1 n=1 Tax=Heliorestis convoluta TaxID=356322 RepID=A0A5Q2N002_9FIRM|nr:Peptidase M56 BlaR1 [Heliorestis convoluta]